MKKVLTISLLIFFFSAAIAQSWPQSWMPVGNGLNYGGYVNALYAHDSVLYAGGVFNSPGNNIAQWNGSSWDTLRDGVNGAVFSFGYYKEKVYIGGWFSRAGRYSAGSIATWDGKKLANAGFNVEGGIVDALQVYDSLLYIGGGFDATNNTQLISKQLISWDGTRTDSVGTYKSTSILYGSNHDAVFCLTTYHKLLFIGNEYTPITSWNNHRDSTYVVYYGIDTYCMNVCNKDLYIGVNNNIAVYDSTMRLLNDFFTNGTVYALTSYGNLLFAGGDFDTVEEYQNNSVHKVIAHNVAMWNGKQWSALGSGLNGPVYALAVFGGNLYAGGNFTSPGNGMAEYAGPLGVAELKNTYNTAIYPNPGTGLFTLEVDCPIQLPPNTELKVYNLLGSMVYSGEITATIYHLNMTGKTPGIYFYSISISGGTSINSGKFIVE